MTTDERLLAGRHHLDNGIRALRTGFLDESRSHFQAALLQFRGPELRLGEAHALRGLAEVELHGGRLQPAETAVRQALGEYVEVRGQLDRIDPDHVSFELRREAEEGEAAGNVLLGELLLRGGRTEEARSTLGFARELYSGLGEDVPSAAGVWLNFARLGMRESRYADARAAAEKAISILARAHDSSGQASAWLLLAEIERLGERFDRATAAIDEATKLADATRQPALQGRASSQRAALLAQQNHLEAAEAAYSEALGKIREAGDAEMEAFALLGRGEVRSRRQDGGALFDLVEGTRLLGQLDHRHGIGAGMLRLSEHALRGNLPAYALLAAEAARQAWQVADPVRGVGQAYRLEVKALAALKKWPAVVTVAHARAELCGRVQPNAIEVRDFYRDRAPSSLLADLDLLDAEQLQTRAESMVEALLGPTMEVLDLDFQSLGTAAGAMAITTAIGRSTPVPPLVSMVPTSSPLAEAPPATAIPASSTPPGSDPPAATAPFTTADPPAGEDATTEHVDVASQAEPPDEAAPPVTDLPPEYAAAYDRPPPAAGGDES